MVSWRVWFYTENRGQSRLCSVVLWDSRQPQPHPCAGWLTGEKRGLCIQFEPSRGSEGGWNPVAFQFSSILFQVWGQGFVCISPPPPSVCACVRACMLYLNVERMGLGREGGGDLQALSDRMRGRSRRALLPLFLGDPCTVPCAVESHGCCIGCDSVHAHSANRKQGSLLYVLSMEIKCQELGPKVSLMHPPYPAVGGGEDQGSGPGREFWSCNSCS